MAGRTAYFDKKYKETQTYLKTTMWITSNSDPGDTLSDKTDQDALDSRCILRWKLEWKVKPMPLNLRVPNANDWALFLKNDMPNRST